MSKLVPVVTHTEAARYAFCVVNGKCQSKLPGVETTLEWLREEVNCTDVRRACETGHCGVCAIVVDGESLKACSVLARELEGRQIFTSSALALTGRRAAVAMVRATEARQPFQCGYCQPAFLIAATDLLERNASPTEAEIRSAFAGLLCRCTGYQSIVETVLLAAKYLRESPHLNVN